MSEKGILKWLKKWWYWSLDITEKEEWEILCDDKKPFSPMTCQNPCISCMKQIVLQVMEKRNILCGNLRLVIIDAEKEEDNCDIQRVLGQFGDMLNFLLLVTDRPDYFEDYADTMFQENGLIVQQTPRTGCGNISGNLVLDFERSDNMLMKHIHSLEMIYIPVYKKPWEICENLDIIVPVGYNTLVVSGIMLPQWKDGYTDLEGLFENKLDRLDQEFRKG